MLTVNTLSNLHPIEVRTHGNVGPFVAELSHDQFLVYHELWRALHKGQRTPFRRAPLPVELIRIISRTAYLVVPDKTLTREVPTGIRVRCSFHSFSTQVWFWTRPMGRIALGNIAGVQLITESQDQGWADEPELGSRAWFDIGVIPLPLSVPLQSTTKLTDIKSTKSLRTLQGYPEESKEEVEDTIKAALSMDPRWRRSHGCPPGQSKAICIEGPIVTDEDEMWKYADDGDLNTIAVRVDVMFRGWQNETHRGVLRVWKHFEPVIL